MGKRRANGEGTIFKNDKDIWCWRKKIGVKPDGKPLYKCLSSKSQSVLMQKVNEYNLLTLQGINSLSEVVLRDYILTWLNTIKVNTLKYSSFDREESTIRTHIIPKIGFYKIKDLTAEIIQSELINAMKRDNLSYSSINKAFVCINDCLNYAVKNRKLLYNCCDSVVLPEKHKFTEKEIRFFNDEEIAKFKKSASSIIGKKRKRFPYGYLFIFDLYTGLRIGELLALKWSDVDIEQKIITVKKSMVMVYTRDKDTNERGKRKPLLQNNTKSRSSNRIVTMSKSAVEAIKKYKELNYHGEDTLIMSADGITPVMTTNAVKSFKRILVNAEINSNCGIHTLRHTYASLLFRNGVDVKTVSELLGHKNVAFTYNTYVHLIKEQKSKATDLLDNI